MGTRTGLGVPLKTESRNIATRHTLQGTVEQGTMREDFFFRLSIISITIPSLKERKEDLPFLIDYFLAQHRKGANRTMLPGKVLQALYRHEWPGNIRELQNVLQRYLTLNRLEFPGSRHARLLAVQEAGSEVDPIRTARIAYAVDLKNDPNYHCAGIVIRPRNELGNFMLNDKIAVTSVFPKLPGEFFMFATYGVHNPSYAMALLTNSLEALTAK